MNVIYKPINKVVVRRYFLSVLLVIALMSISYSQLYLSADCITGKADLTGITASNPPTGTTVTWHTETPATTGNKISPTDVMPGTYHSAFYDANGDCYSTHTTTVTITAPLCLTNSCPEISVNLNTGFSASNLPANTSVSWHTSYPASNANKISDPTTVSVSGNYFAAIYDAGSGCYSGDGYAASEIIVTITTCPTCADTGTPFFTDYVLLYPTSGLALADCDGDGVNNVTEVNDGTDPNNGCSYTAANQIYANTSGAWKALDCDSDGLTNAEEVDPNNDGTPGPNGTNPKDPDTDDDGLLDGEEVNGIDNPSTLANPSGMMTDPNNPDSDGDGVTDGDERTSNNGSDPLTDANNPCIYNAVEQLVASTSAGWKATDCDGDGVTNFAEAGGPDANPLTLGDNTNPIDACRLNLSQVTLAATSTGDCDGDGVTNANEINSSGMGDSTTDPNDPCEYNVAEQVFANTSSVWNALDCDEDGNPNGTDQNPKIPAAVDDSVTTVVGSSTSINILANDDFLSGANTTISQVGGTAGGTVVFNPSTGIMSYTPLISEAGTTKTLVYQVCNTPPNPDVCASATVTLIIPTLTDTDGDGDPDISDPAYNDPCVYSNNQVVANTSSVWKSSDCDGDGVTNYAEAGGPDGDPFTLGDNTDLLDACSLNLFQVTLSATSTGDCDGDGVNNANEINGIGPGDPITDPNNPCVYNVTEQTYTNSTTIWKALDCDNDDLTNSQEIDPDDDGNPGPNGTDAKLADTDGDGLYDGEEVLGIDNPGSQANPGGMTTDANNTDTDGDGVTDGDERTSNGSSDTLTSAVNHCIYNSDEQVYANTSAGWKATDCDGDGWTNGVEVDPDGDGTPGPNGTDPLVPNIVLNVEITKFEGWWDKINDVNKLLWKTFSEINSDYFEVQRSFNGSEFLPIGQVKSISNANLINYYNYDDFDTNKKGMYSYRLRQIGMDGIEAFSEIVNINVKSDANQNLTIYPNPSTEIINFDLIAEEGDNVIGNIYDNLGKLVQKDIMNEVLKETKSTFRLNVSNFQPGIYSFVLKINGKYTNHKLIVLR